MMAQEGPDDNGNNDDKGDNDSSNSMVGGREGGRGVGEGAHDDNNIVLILPTLLKQQSNEQ